MQPVLCKACFLKRNGFARLIPYANSEWDKLKVYYSLNLNDHNESSTNSKRLLVLLFAFPGSMSFDFFIEKSAT